MFITIKLVAFCTYKNVRTLHSVNLVLLKIIKVMSEFVRHYVRDMESDLMQVCIYCGELISDYRNTMVYGGGKIKGWSEGYVYVLKNGSTTNYCTILKEGVPFKICSER